ncbi:hypothetical protein [Steroidobacter agaridevorans]|uniref:hypothetical protein n=1 Tax=Steroidobacter agaridevorans TaxID=2695856 RepID=UPI00132B1AD8|nr:hypothetical protein [Steroidobacter agaridevorans]GFE88604.1 hypothetical protein GCM10011488_35580 [Steroidobacter agaridevorans]
MSVVKLVQARYRSDAAQSVLDCSTAGTSRLPLISPNLKSPLNKTPNYKQQKKRREDMQKKKNEEKQRQQAARKASDLPPPKP